MTDDLPRNNDRLAVFCDNCNAAVRLRRDDHNSLELTCACGETRDVQVRQVLPEGWQA